jgi:hypothetical protein
VIITVYIDESGTHDSSVTIMAGWVGRLGQWAAFDPRWKKLLKCNDLTYFHSKKMRHSQGEFKGWSLPRRRAFMGDASKIALRNLEFGFAIPLREDDYLQYYIADNRPNKLPLDSRYGLCFRYCLSLIPLLAKSAFDGRDDLEIHFVLESGHKNAGGAEQIFNVVKKSPEPQIQEIVRMLKTITFRAKSEFPGLQMADVNAYGAYQHETRLPLQTIQLSPKTCMKDAKRIQRVPIFNLRLGENELKRFRQNAGTAREKTA